MSADPKKYRAGPDAQIADIDLDVETVNSGGERLTERRAETLARQALDEIRRNNLVPGRKSLSGGSVHSPRVQFRVPESIREEAERRAAAEGKSLSTLAREALERYLRAS